MRAFVLLCQIACFASFGWAMVWHFRPTGKPEPGMLLTAAVVPVFAALHVTAVLARHLVQPRAAILLYANSLALFWFAIAATRGKDLARCFQPHVPPAVVRSGPYRHIRHPFYTAYSLAWAGGFVATGWWPLAATAVVMAYLYHQAAIEEEQAFVESVHGEEYRSYLRQTGRFLPRLRPRQ